MKHLLFLLLMLPAPLVQAQELYLIPTLHRLHLVNEQYNYDTLRQLIARINPDVIAVEIRTEDLDLDTAYLKNLYPLEMWMARYWFPDKIIAGFDWLGSDLEGKRIPENYWTDISPVKRLQQAFNKDTVYARQFAPCLPFAAERLGMLQTLSLKELLKSNDVSLTLQYYDCMANQLKATPYAALPLFYETRNQKILANLETIQKLYPNKKIVVLTGDDHFAYLKGRLPLLPLPL